MSEEIESDFWKSVERLKKTISDSIGSQISSQAVRTKAKTLVQEYFRFFRPRIALLRAEVPELDRLMQELLQVSNVRGTKNHYLDILKETVKMRSAIELASERKLSDDAHAQHLGEIGVGSATEQLIMETLGKMVPASITSYRQVLMDLYDANRISYRGTACELREILREIVDHLAPDKSVIAQPGFKLEKDATKPTMKQKVKFIFKSRGQSEATFEAPLRAVEALDEAIGALSRSVYTRASLSTHIPSSKKEVLQLKMYTDTVLCDLLEIHAKNTN